MWVRCFAHILSEVLRLVQHDLALARVMRVLVAMHMAVKLAAKPVFERFDGNLSFLSLFWRALCLFSSDSMATLAFFP